MTAHEEQVIDAMQRYGGSFVKVIAAAYRVADSENRDRLRTAFSGYWAYYGMLAKDAPPPVQSNQSPDKPEHERG